MDVDSVTERFIAGAKQRFPDWTGFSDPRFVKEEIGYKRQASAKARESLSAEAFRELIGKEAYGELLDRVRKVASSTNLLYLSTPTTGDLGLLYQATDRRALCLALQDLLHGPGSPPDRLDRFSAYAEKEGLPNRWTLPTVLLFLMDPSENLFIKPSVVQWLLGLGGEQERWEAKPSGALYRYFVELAAGVRDRAAQYGARDLLDAQSLIWVGRWASKTRGIRRWDQFTDLLERCRIEYLQTPTGEKHLAQYLRSREPVRGYLEDLARKRAAGVDVTDEALLHTLPHLNSTNNRERGAWIAVQPAVTKDIKSWFEGAGWRKAGDWGAVAKALLDFYIACDNDPSALEAACQAFNDSPFSKGLQTGIVTPFLAALRPDDYAVINNKSRRVVNYFTESAFKASLADYPGANAAAHRLIEALPAELLELLPTGAHPSDLLDAFSHWLVAVIKYDFGSQRYWKVAPGEQAWQWEECRDQGFIAVGWDEIGDLTGVTKKEFDERLAKMLDLHDDWTKQGANQVFQFATRIAEGDRVVANRGIRAVVGIGTVTGPYYYVPGANHAHRLPVEWEDTEVRKVNEPAWVRTLLKLDKETFDRISGAPATQTTRPENGPAQSPPPPPTPTQADYPLETCAAETGIEIATLKTWLGSLDRKKQAVIYGPPGTGKTFVAERLAKHLAGTNGFFEILQFHPSYSYEDFIQGIRPEANTDGTLLFSMRPGRFLTFCERARKVEGPAVLIIDEINRANLSKVFGELMYLLEYRDRDIPLGGGGRLAVPSNVRIIGTMNTADRSIALVDHALRRRFAFIPLYPDFDILEKYLSDLGGSANDLIQVLGALNQEIGDRNLEVGGSFFMTPDLTEDLESIWRMEIEPYLEEIFFDRPDTLAEYRWVKVGPKVSLS